MVRWSASSSTRCTQGDDQAAASLAASGAPRRHTTGPVGRQGRGRASYGGRRAGDNWVIERDLPPQQYVATAAAATIVQTENAPASAGGCPTPRQRHTRRKPGSQSHGPTPSTRGHGRRAADGVRRCPSWLPRPAGRGPASPSAPVPMGVGHLCVPRSPAMRPRAAVCWRWVAPSAVILPRRELEVSNVAPAALPALRRQPRAQR